MTARQPVAARHERWPGREWWWLQAAGGRMVAYGFATRAGAELWAAEAGYPVGPGDDPARSELRTLNGAVKLSV